MPVLNGLSDLTYLIVAVLGGLQVLAGHLTIGNMQAFVQYVWQINQPIQNLTQLAGQLRVLNLPWTVFSNSWMNQTRLMMLLRCLKEI